WRWKLPANSITWSDEMCRIFGLRAGQFGGNFEAAMAYVFPEDREQVLAVVNCSRQTHEPFTVSHRILRPDGAVRFIQGKGKVVLDTADNPIEMVGTAQDITEPWEAQKRIREQAALLDKAR